MNHLFTWQKALMRSDLPRRAKYVGLVLSLYMDPMSNGAVTTHKRLADDTGYCRSLVTKAIGELEAAGFLEVEQQESNERAYVPTFPKPAARR